MANKTAQKEAKPKGGIPEVKLALGAAGLLLFIVGVKRTYQTETGAKVTRNQR